MVYLRQLSVNDGIDIYMMLKEINVIENSFTNPVNEMNYEQYREWLIQQDKWSRNEGLPHGFVGQTVYWLYDDIMPIGFGKLRHELTDASRMNGGNVGYAIRPSYRGKGYGKTLLMLLIAEAREKGISEIVLTVDKLNWPSRKVIEKNHGIMFDENDERWFFRV